MGAAMLYRWEAEHTDELADDPVRMLESLSRQMRRQLDRRRPVSDYPLKMIGLLKTIVALQNDPEALKEHQQAYRDDRGDGASHE